MTKFTYPLPESEQAIAADLAKKMMKAAGNQRPEILAGAALLVIQLICFMQESSKGTK